MRQGLISGILLSLLLLAAGSTHAAVRPLTDVQAKLVIIHNFISQYVRWPGRYSLDETRQIYICSQGEDELTQALPLLEQASTDDLQVSVVRDPGATELTICHVMVFADSQKWDYAAMLKKIRHYPVLTFSGLPHFLDKGGMVAFETNNVRQGNFEQRYIRYSINSGALAKAQLVVEPDAIELAERVLP